MKKETINYNQIKELVILANRLDQIGLYKEASVIDEILIKESGFMENLSKKIKQLGLAAGLGLGSAAVYPSITSDVEVIRRNISELNESDFEPVTIEKGQTLEDVAREYYKDIDTQTGIDIILDLNKLILNKEINPRKLKINQTINVPKIESLQQVGYEKEIGMGLTDEDSVRAPSQDLIQMLRDHEKTVLKVYDTKAKKGDYTIGIGHKLKDDELRNFLAGKPITIHGITIRPSKSGYIINAQQAEKIFKADLENTRSIIDRCNFRNLTQQQYDALTSFVFNVGSVPNSIRGLIISGQTHEVPAVMMRYNKSGGEESSGLTKRREAEAKLWNERDYS